MDPEAFIFFGCFWKRDSGVHQDVARIFLTVNGVGPVGIQPAKLCPASWPVGTDLKCHHAQKSFALIL